MNASATTAELMVLRPTNAFVDVLNKLIAPQSARLVLTHDLLKTDATVYILPHLPTPKETANAIEARFKDIIKYELSRWITISNNALSNITFLEFFIYFTFDFHNHVLSLVDTSFQQQKLTLNPKNYVLVLKPKLAVKEWMKKVLENDERILSIIEKTSLDHIAENAAVVVKEFEDQKEIISFIKENAKEIFEFELQRMCSDMQMWPANRDLNGFLNFYDIEIHSKLINMLD